MKHNPEFLKTVENAKQSVKEITIEAFIQQGGTNGTYTVVDVREDDEWESGHLPGAIHLGKGVIERDIEKQISDKDTALILYCGGGFRSAIAAESIQKMGYTNVLSLSSGVRGWKAINGEMVTG